MNALFVSIFFTFTLLLSGAISQTISSVISKMLPAFGHWQLSTSSSELSISHRTNFVAKTTMSAFSGQSVQQHCSFLDKKNRPALDSTR